MKPFKDDASLNWRTGRLVQIMGDVFNLLLRRCLQLLIEIAYASFMFPIRRVKNNGSGVTSWSLSKMTHRSIGGQEDWFKYGRRNYRICSIGGQEDRFHFSATIMGDVFNLLLKLRTLLVCFQKDRFWHNYDIFMLPERCIFMYLLMLLNRELFRLFCAYIKKRFFSMLIPSLWNIMLILTLGLFFLFTIRIKKLLRSMIHSPTRNIRWSLLAILLKMRM